MTYILDLQRLWEGNAIVTPEIQQAAASVYLDPRKNVVSAIVVAHPDESTLLQTLQSVLAQQFVREVIIVNPERCVSLERTLTKFSNHHPKCYIVNGQKSAGLAAAYNLGARYASGQFLLFLSGRSVLPKNAILNLLATGIRKPTPWIIGTADNDISRAQAKQSWGPLKDLFGNMSNPLKYERSDIHVFPEVSLPGGGFHTSTVSPGCLLLSTNTFLGLNGMDKKCFHSTFHADLCLRIHFAGGGVYRVRELDLVTHSEPALSFREHLQKEWHALCGSAHFYQKHVSLNNNKVLMGLLYCGIAFRFLGRLCSPVLRAILFKPSKKIALAKQTSLN